MAASDWNRKTIAEFNAKHGRGIGPWGDNLLLMTARGAKTGTEITTPLVYRRDGDNLVVVASKGGAPDHPQWLHNLEVNPMLEVEVAADDGTEKVKARAKALRSGPERDRLFEYMMGVWPAFADYQKRTERLIPVVVLEPVQD